MDSSSSVGIRFFPLNTAVLTGVVLPAGLLCLSSLGWSAGFAVNETSAAAAGTAYSGRVASPDDASVQAANPAAMAALEQMQWTLGGALVFPKGKISGAQAVNAMTVPTGQADPPSRTQHLPVTGNDGKTFLSSQLIPSGYFANPINEKLSFGFGVYAPFGAVSKYDKHFVGRYLAVNTELKNINLQPTVSWKLDDNFSLGAGVFASYMDGELTRRLNLLTIPGKLVHDALSKVTGDGWGFGAKLGLYWHKGDTSVGLSYTSPVNFKLEGQVNVTAPVQPLPGGREVPAVAAKADGHLKVKLPQMLEFGVTQQINEQLTLTGGLLWTGWSSFKEINIVVDQPLALRADRIIPKGSTVNYVPEKWKDVWSFSLGGRYQLNSQWLLRAGYAFDKSPVDNKHRTARIPDADRNWLTVGTRYSCADRWLVDMAYGFMVPKTVKVNEHPHNPATRQADEGSYLKGKYKISAHLLMVSLTHRY